MLHHKQQDYRAISFFFCCGLLLLTHFVNSVSFNRPVQHSLEGTFMDRLSALTTVLESDLLQHTMSDDTTVTRGTPTYRLALEVAGQIDLDLERPITFGHVRRMLIEAQSELEAAA